MPDIQLNGQSITTASTSGTTAPSAGTSESWSVVALSAGIPALGSGGQTYALIDSAPGSVQNEKIRITACTGSGATTITVTRGVDGTTPVAHATGATFNIVMLRDFINDDLFTLAPSYGRGLGLANRYDKLRGCYNIKSSNTRRSDQGLGRCMSGGMSEHIWIGTSESAGCNSNLGTILFDRLNATPLSFRNSLANAGVPANGTGLIRTVDSVSFADARCASAGTWSNQGAYALSTVAASTWSVSPDRSGTSINVLYYDYASTSGQFTVKVDGTTVATISVTGTNPVTGTGWKLARITGVNVLANFSTVVVTVVAPGTSGLFFAGMEIYQPNAGLRMHNLAQSGSTASGTGLGAWVDATVGSGLGYVYHPNTGLGGATRQVTDAASTVGSNTLTSATAAFTTADLDKPVDIPPGTSGPMFPQNAYISGITSATAVTLSYIVNGAVTNANAYATLTAQTVNIGRPPDVVHLELSGNDLNNGVAIPTIISAISTLRSRYSTSDCILHLPVEFSTAYVSAATELAFQQALLQLADTLDVMVVDWRDQVGSYAQGQAAGWYGDNAVHLNPSADMMIGASLAAVLGPGAGRNQTQLAPVYDNDVIPKWYVDNRRTTTATAAALTTVETVLLTLRVPANTLKVGSMIRYSGFLSPTSTTVTTTRLRIGATGTTADAAVVVMSATAAANASVRTIQGEAAVQVVGASGNFLGNGTEQVGAITAAGTATATSGTFDTTKALYVTLTVQNSVTGTTTAKAGILELVV